MAKAEAKPKAVAKKNTAIDIVAVSETILEKLKSLKSESGLQSDITWCLGSYSHDRNPVGLYEKAAQALTVFKAEQAKKTKGITAKLISDIEKVLAAK
ncbi:MAG: hypothetical protein JST43_13230 [Bacteroidetes bacterium]|nr:hypothetical protein [Bacteroidota bacterium]MBS1541858.1 hypothetical protein [Bacteroidota bacterium]